MTIAAGFVYPDGVLLCSDSQVETNGQKAWGKKIGRFTRPWGAASGVMAGNADYATAAFQALERKSLDGPMAFEDLEGCLKHSYEENVFKHPLYPHQLDTLWYSLLIGLFIHGEERPRLYVTNDATIHEIRSFRCEGIGRDVGHTVLKPLWRPDMDLRSLIHLAAYMLAIVKNNVPGCGGPSQFAILNKQSNGEFDGSAYSVMHIENVYGWFDQVSSEFLLKHMCESDADFDSYLKELKRHARYIRSLWKKQVKAVSRSSHQSTTAAL